MLAIILFIAFVGAYSAIVLLGHALLLFAVWPGLLPKRRVFGNNDAGLSEAGPASVTGPHDRKLAA